MTLNKLQLLQINSLFSIQKIIVIQSANVCHCLIKKKKVSALTLVPLLTCFTSESSLFFSSPSYFDFDKPFFEINFFSNQVSLKLARLELNDSPLSSVFKFYASL